MQNEQNEFTHEDQIKQTVQKKKYFSKSKLTSLTIAIASLIGMIAIFIIPTSKSIQVQHTKRQVFRKSFNVSKYYGMARIPSHKQLPFCILAPSNIVAMPGFGNLQDQIHKNFHVVVLKSTEQKLQIPPAIKAKEVSWSDNSNYYDVKNVIQNNCGQKQIVFIMRNYLQNNQTLTKLNHKFQVFFIWLCYFQVKTQKYQEFYIVAFYREIYDKLDLNDYSNIYRNSLHQNNFYIAVSGLISLASEKGLILNITYFFPQQQKQMNSFILDTLIEKTKNITLIAPYRSLLTITQTKYVKSRNYRQRQIVGIGFQRQKLILQMRRSNLFYFTQNIELKNLPQNHSLFELHKNYMEEKYDLYLFKDQLPMCVVVLSQNNAQHKIYKHILQTITYQNYKNYHIVFIDDFSTDNTTNLTKQYMKKINFPEDRIKYIYNKEKMYGTANIKNAAQNYCGPKQIFVLLDGDDQIVGTQVFRLINSYYLREKKYNNWIVYTNHYSNRYRIAHSQNSSNIQKVYNNGEMRARHYFGMIRTFITQLFLKIKDKDLNDDEGNYFNISYSQVIQYPLFQMAERHTEYIPQLCYLYNKQPYNFTKVHYEEQKIIEILNRKPYQKLDSLQS